MTAMRTPGKPRGTERPVIDEDVTIRVKQWASKEGITNREAYRRLLLLLLDDEGNIKNFSEIAEGI